MFTYPGMIGAGSRGSHSIGSRSLVARHRGQVPRFTVTSSKSYRSRPLSPSVASVPLSADTPFS